MTIETRVLDRAPTVPTRLLELSHIVSYDDLEKLGQFVVDAHYWVSNTNVRHETIMRLNYALQHFMSKADLSSNDVVESVIGLRVVYDVTFGWLLKSRTISYTFAGVEGVMPDCVADAFASYARRYGSSGIKLPDGAHVSPEGREGISNYSADVIQAVQGIRSPDGFFPNKEAVGDKGLWLGVELEVEYKNPKWKGVIMDITRNSSSSPFYGYAICKHDASIADGFEIVTAPSTYEWIRDEGVWYKWAERYGPYLTGESTGGRAGMHVHVSKDYFRTRPLTGAKLKTFLNGDSSWGCFNEHLKFVQSVAGRRNTGHSQYGKAKISEGFFDTDGLGGGPRSSVLNSNKRDTHEFRLFASSACARSIMKNVCFVQAAIEFCQTSSMKALDYLAFVDWMQSQGERFPELYQYLQDKGWIEGEPAFGFGEAISYRGIDIRAQEGGASIAWVASKVQEPYSHLRIQ